MAHCHRCGMVCVYVCLLVITTSCDKTDEPIEVPFGLSWTKETHIRLESESASGGGNFWGHKYRKYQMCGQYIKLIR